MSAPDTLNETRGATHGNFSRTAEYAVRIRDVIAGAQKDRAQPLTFREVEALNMIAVKMARILSGDSSFPDHWDDIAGYAKLAITDV